MDLLGKLFGGADTAPYWRTAGGELRVAPPNESGGVPFWSNLGNRDHYWERGQQKPRNYVEIGRPRPINFRDGSEMAARRLAQEQARRDLDAAKKDLAKLERENKSRMSLIRMLGLSSAYEKHKAGASWWESTINSTKGAAGQMGKLLLIPLAVTVVGALIVRKVAK